MLNMYKYKYNAKYIHGTKTSSPLDGDKFTDFWIDLMKILFFGKI